MFKLQDKYGKELSRVNNNLEFSMNNASVFH